jgi:hypothetical protein
MTTHPGDDARHVADQLLHADVAIRHAMDVLPASAPHAHDDLMAARLLLAVAGQSLLPDHGTT